MLAHLNDHLHIVRRHLCVRGGKRQALALSLRDQHPIERIGVMLWKRPRGLGMCPGNRQRTAARIGRNEEQIIWDRQFTKRPFDPDFPNACGREVHITRCNRRALRLCQPRVIQHRPEQDMGVEQEAHSAVFGLVEHLRDLSISVEDVLRQRKRPGHSTDQRSPDRAFCGDDPGHRAAIPSKLDCLPCFGAADQFGKLCFGFGDGNLQGAPFYSD